MAIDQTSSLPEDAVRPRAGAAAPSAANARAIAVGLWVIAVWVGLWVGQTTLGTQGPRPYFLPIASWLALLCMVLGPVEVALRRSKGTNPKLAASVCVLSVLFCFALASGLGSLPSELREVVGIGSLVVMFLATCVLVRHRCVLGVAGIVSFLAVGA